jgi:ABC-type polysaccharide/polyol phosphate export permease
LTSVTFAKWRDLGRIVNLVLRIGFYFTPVFFTLEMMIASRLPPEAVEIYLALNPMAILLTILRYTITGEGSNLSLNNIVLCFANILFTYILASVWFNKKKDKGAKYL